MSHRHYQLDVSGTLTAHLLLGHLHTAAVADDTLITDTLVLTAGALIVFGRTEDTLTEETVALRLISTVVDGLGFCDLSKAILKDLLGRCKSDGDLRKIILYL